MLAGRQTNGAWQELGLLTAWFSLFLSSNKACTTRVIPRHAAAAWGTQPAANRSQEPSLQDHSVTHLALCVQIMLL